MRKCLCVSRMNCTSESTDGTAYKLSHALWHRFFCCCEVAELLENYWFVLSIFLHLAIFLFTLHFIGDFDSRFEVFDRRFYPDASYNWALFCPSQEYFIGVCGCFSHSVLEASTQSHFLAHFLAYEYIFETQRMPVCLNYMRARSQAIATRCCTFRVCVFFGYLYRNESMLWFRLQFLPIFRCSISGKIFSMIFKEFAISNTDIVGCDWTAAFSCIA